MGRQSGEPQVGSLGLRTRFRVLRCVSNNLVLMSGSRSVLCERAHARFAEGFPDVESDQALLND